MKDTPPHLLSGQNFHGRSSLPVYISRTASYLLFCAVQKARVSTQGVKVRSLISECVGAKGFEADTYIEMALRDVQLFPGLEGNAHINLAMTARFIDRYFSRPDGGLIVPPLGAAGENPYLMEARAGGADAVASQHF